MSTTTDLLFARAWLMESVHDLHSDLRPWLITGGLYMLMVLTLLHIPFAGWLLVILLTPLLLGGVLTRFTTPDDRDHHAFVRFSVHLRDAVRRLFCVFPQERLLLPLMVQAVVIFVVVLILLITAQVLRVGSATFGLMLSGTTSKFLFLQALMSAVLIGGMALIVAMMTLYAVPLSLVRRRPPLVAFTESINACAAHPTAIALFAGGFVLVYGLGQFLHAKLPFPGDDVCALLLGSFTAPLFTLMLWRSFRDLFPGRS